MPSIHIRGVNREDLDRESFASACSMDGITSFKTAVLLIGPNCFCNSASILSRDCNCHEPNPNNDSFFSFIVKPVVNHLWRA